MVKEIKPKDKDFEELYQEIECGVSNYETYMIPKGAMSDSMVNTLKESFDVWEEFINDSIAENVEGIGDESRKLKYYERWHYCFTKKGNKKKAKTLLISD